MGAYPVAPRKQWMEHMRCIIFYSWQSDLPNATNRGFIQQALERAAGALANDAALQIEPVIDRDTVGVPGAPDIANTIFAKIDAAHVVVCDVSLVHALAGARRTPNPNVLIELGYALKALGSEQLILICNTAFGGVELLPFDLRSKRVLTYAMPTEAEERAPARRQLEKQLEYALRGVIAELLAAKESAAVQPVMRRQPLWKRLSRRDWVLLFVIIALWVSLFVAYQSSITLFMNMIAMLWPLISMPVIWIPMTISILIQIFDARIRKLRRQQSMKQEIYL